MTAKHRKGKSNHKQDDNFFKNEVMETEVRAGGNNYTLLLVLNAIILIGGATCAWFCFQQHQTLTYLTDNLMGIQMKIMKLQSFHEEMRQSKSKQPMSESMETRLSALEESYALTQKQVGIALGTAEQLKTSDLPTQVLSLHTEMKARLAEMQQATVSVEQLSQLQSMLKGKSEEFEDVRTQVEGLATQNGELFQKVEAVTGSLGEAESKLEEKNDQIATLSATLNGQATEVLRLKDQLDKYQSRLEASILEMATVREFLENEQSQQLQQANVEEQLNTVRQSLQDHNSAAQSLQSELRAQLENIQKKVTQLVGETQPPAEPQEQMEEETAAASGEEGVAAATEVEDAETAASAVEEETVEATEEELSLPTGEEQGASSPGEEGTLADEQEEAPVEQEDSETEETVPEEEGETQQEEPVAVSEKEDVDATQTEENREDDEEEAAPEEESQGAADEDVEAEGDEEDEDVRESQGEEELRDGEEEEEEEQQEVAAEEDPQEEEEEEESLEDDALPENECKKSLLH